MFGLVLLHLLPHPSASASALPSPSPSQPHHQPILLRRLFLFPLSLLSSLLLSPSRNLHLDFLSLSSSISHFSSDCPAHRASNPDPSPPSSTQHKGTKTTHQHTNSQHVRYTSTATGRRPCRARALDQIHWKAFHSRYVIHLFSPLPLLTSPTLPLRARCPRAFFLPLPLLLTICPAAVDHTPQPHPASPTNSLPADFTDRASHVSFSEYRQRSQQYGPLRNTISRLAETGIGGAAAAGLPSIEPAKGMFFDRDELPARFRRSVWSAEEIEAIESGGATMAA